jgi:mRNA-degrading endonuclease RelE of RelBE toxin-antitoxin system
MRKISLHHQAQKYLNRLPEPDKGQIERAILGLRSEPMIGDILLLKKSGGRFRLRVRGYRILFKVVDDMIRIRDIAPRGQAYGKRGGKK